MVTSAPSNTSQCFGFLLDVQNQINVDGTVTHYKEMLVAQGYKQQEGLDYFKTFSPMETITIVGLFIRLATYKC